MRRLARRTWLLIPLAVALTSGGVHPFGDRHALLDRALLGPAMGGEIAEDASIGSVRGQGTALPALGHLFTTVEHSEPEPLTRPARGTPERRPRLVDEGRSKRLVASACAHAGVALRHWICVYGL